MVFCLDTIQGEPSWGARLIIRDLAWLLTCSAVCVSRTINGILAMRSFRNQFSTGHRDTNGLALAPSETAIVVAILSVGTVLGALLAAPLGDHFGRRLSLLAAVTIFNIGCVFQVCAQAIPMMLVGRYVQYSSGWDAWLSLTSTDGVL